MPITTIHRTTAAATSTGLQQLSAEQRWIPASQQGYNNGNYANGQGSPDRGYADSDAPPASGWSRHATIPANTEIVVRTIDRIEVRQPDPRQKYLASVDRDVIDSDGNVVIPRGSQVHLIAQNVGNGQMAVDLRSVNVNGQRYMLNSEDITTHAPEMALAQTSARASTSEAAPVLGTLLGAIAGGGVGAAIGALAGGAAGAGTQVLTRGRNCTSRRKPYCASASRIPLNLYQ